ncbi:hypothetical protein KA107_02715 [Candidatus Pacearchaeota archaeon]|nr:hypothetical protein [Candidatus Pacearchaeota archaeon]
MRIPSKVKKYVLRGAIGLASLLAVERGVKEMALNAMSNMGWRNEDQREVLNQPSTYLTRGDYRGFLNVLSYDGDESFEPNPDVFKSDPSNKLDHKLRELDLNAVYLGLQKNPLPKSDSRPTSLTDSQNREFYSLKDFIFAPEKLVESSRAFLNQIEYNTNSMKEGESVSVPHQHHETSYLFSNVDLHRYTLSVGKDEKGIYTSLYDTWDFNPKDSVYFRDDTQHDWQKNGAKILDKLGKPIHFYDRFYWKDFATTNETLNEEWAE